MMVCTCEDGRITHLDECLDSTHPAPLLDVVSRHARRSHGREGGRHADRQ